MLKSTLIKLRRQPKLVREQAALWVAGGFTFAIFAVWAFTLPGQLGVPERQTASVIDNLKEDFVNESPDLSGVSEGFQLLREEATPAEEQPAEVVVEELPEVTEVEPTQPETEAKEVRIITTSSSSEPDVSQ